MHDPLYKILTNIPRFSSFIVIFLYIFTLYIWMDHMMSPHVWLMPRLYSHFYLSIFGQPLTGLYINTP